MPTFKVTVVSSVFYCKTVVAPDERQAEALAWGEDMNLEEWEVDWVANDPVPHTIERIDHEEKETADQP